MRKQSYRPVYVVLLALAAVFSAGMLEPCSAGPADEEFGAANSKLGVTNSKPTKQSAKFEPLDGSTYTGVSLNRPKDWSVKEATRKWDAWTALMGSEQTAISHEFTTLDNWPQWAYRIADARGVSTMLSLEPQGGYESEFTTTEIANGDQDNYIFRHLYFARKHGMPMFIRLGHEMNGNWYSYSAYNADGSRRSNSAADYRQMWRRVVIIFRGGYVRDINSELAKHDLPPLNGETDLPKWMDYPPLDDVKSYIPPAHNVAFVWTPNSLSIPDVRGNQPSDYYPGDEFVDWVGQDVYHAPWATSTDKLFLSMDSFYNEFAVKRGKPYMIGELGLEAHPSGRNSDNPAFIRRVIRWYEDHPRAKALIYWSWDAREGRRIFRSLEAYPNSADVLANAWQQERFLSEVNITNP